MAYQRNVNRSTEAKVATYSYNITAWTKTAQYKFL